MSQLIDLYFKKEVLQKVMATMEQKAKAGDEKAGKGISITVSVNDEVRGDYGQNVSAFVAQTKEQREAGKEKFYVANGKTFWSNNGEFIPGKEPSAAAQTTVEDSNEIDDLPF